MKSSNANKHLTLEERIIIDHGIRNGSSKSVISTTLGKDKSTIGKEIKVHQKLTYKCPLPLECTAYKHSKLSRSCKRRDRSPGACIGCQTINTCRFNQFFYSPSDVRHDYRMTLVTLRERINYTEAEVITIDNIIQPEIRRGLSPYTILPIHPEITMSKKTIYNFIETKIFKNDGIDLIALDLRRQTEDQ